MPRSTAEREALAIFPGALGDFVCFEPALAAIRARSGGPVLIICKGSLVPLCEAADLGPAYPIEGPASAWLFSRTPPREAATFFGRFSSIDCFTGVGVPEVEQNLLRWSGGSARVHPFRPAERTHLAVHFLRCVGDDRQDLPEPRLRFRSETLAAARAEHRGLLNRRSTLVVHPGSGGSHKRWSRAGFQRLLERWSKKGGAAIVLLGPAERGEGDLWVASGADVLPSPDWRAMAAILGSSSAYLGNDSGPSHFAAAVGARGVVLFGPSDPECWRPLSPRIRVMQLEPWTRLDEDPVGGEIEAIESALSTAIDGASRGKSP